MDKAKGYCDTILNNNTRFTVDGIDDNLCQGVQDGYGLHQCDEEGTDITYKNKTDIGNANKCLLEEFSKSVETDESLTVQSSFRALASNMYNVLQPIICWLNPITKRIFDILHNFPKLVVNDNNYKTTIMTNEQGEGSTIELDGNTNSLNINGLNNFYIGSSNVPIGKLFSTDDPEGAINTPMTDYTFYNISSERKVKALTSAERSANKLASARRIILYSLSFNDSDGIYYITCNPIVRIQNWGLTNVDFRLTMFIRQAGNSTWLPGSGASRYDFFKNVNKNNKAIAAELFCLNPIRGGTATVEVCLDLPEGFPINISLRKYDYKSTRIQAVKLR